MRRARRLRTVLALALVAAGRLAGAHDTTPKPTAVVTITPGPTDVVVTAHLPLVALTDVNWPRQPDGALTASAVAEPLALVARDFASRLELSEGDHPLPLPVSRATLAPDGASVDIALEYMLPARSGPMAARLRAWPAQPEAVPSVVHFIAAPGVTRTFVVNDGAERIVFQPSVAETLQQFLGRGARQLLEGWAALLFALCLGLTAARSQLPRAAAAWLLTQAVVMAIAGTGLLPMAPLSTVGALAASAVAVAALLGLVAGGAWLTPLGVCFGAANGWLLGDAFAHVTAFAGGHAIVALFTFIAVSLVGYAWLVALVSALAMWLTGRAVPDRLASGVVCLFALHNALHLLDEQTLPSGDVGVGWRSTIVGLVGAWIAVSIAAGWWSSRRLAQTAGHRGAAS